MFANSITRTAAMSAALSVLALGLSVHQAVAIAPVGGFLVVVNEQENFGDSQKCLTFLDASDPTTPLFSVYVGRELFGSDEFEEPESIAVDYSTGDVYIAAFDSGTTGVPDGAGDTQGDLDLYRIPFASVYDHWSNTFEGKDVRNDVTNPDGWVSNPPSGVKNQFNLDYVTYANTFGDFNFNHSNAYALSGVIEKVGEIVRGEGGSFYGPPMTLVDSNTLLMLDDSIGLEAANDPLNDHSLRKIFQKSASPGAATITPVNPGDGGLTYNNGGYNGNTTESWESQLLQKLQMDGASHSEPRALAYYDNGAGIRGVWIAEGDFSSTTMQADKLGFLQLDASLNSLGFRPFTTGGFLAVSDDPFTDPGSNDGKVHEVFVDTNGDLVIVEAGFGDDADGVHAADQEPGVIRVSVDYNFQGSGAMQIGAWEEKVFLTFDGGVTTGDKGVDDTGTEFSQHATYDRENNLVYFFSPDTGGSFNNDLHILDLNTGLTTSYVDFDDSISLFGDANTDTVEYFFLGDAPGLPGDHNEDGKVDAADYVLWRSDPSAYGNAQGYTDWVDNFGAMAGSGPGPNLNAVPEPASAVLLVVGLAALCGLRRNARQ